MPLYDSSALIAYLEGNDDAISYIDDHLDERLVAADGDFDVPGLTELLDVELLGRRRVDSRPSMAAPRDCTATRGRRSSPVDRLGPNV